MQPVQDTYVPAPVATGLLGVRSATLYAYVSRGFVRTNPDPSDPRRRLYHLQDIEALKRRKSLKRPADAAASALDLGIPAMASRISSIDGRRILYRGHDIAAWSARATLEETAALLWDAPAEIFAAPGAVAPRRLAVRIEGRALAAVAQLAAADDGSSLAAGVAVLRTVLAEVVEAAPDGRPAHLQLAGAWGLDDPGADLVRLALALSADYELNPATFAVRVVASTGASTAASVAAGLAAQTSPLHTAQGELIETLFDEAARSGAGAAIDARLATGAALPAFGLQLHEGGDPRARALLQRLPADALRADLIAAIGDRLGKHPNHAFGLVALRRSLALPAEAATGIFLLGRSVGWISHALEQRASGKPIRPRARYVGRREG